MSVPHLTFVIDPLGRVAGSFESGPKGGCPIMEFASLADDESLQVQRVWVDDVLHEVPWYERHTAGRVWLDDRCAVYSFAADVFANGLWLMPPLDTMEWSPFGRGVGAPVSVRPPEHRPPSAWTEGHWPAGLTMREDGRAVPMYAARVCGPDIHRPAFDSPDFNPREWDWLEMEHFEHVRPFAVHLGVLPDVDIGSRVLFACAAEGAHVEAVARRRDVQVFPVVLP